MHFKLEGHQNHHLVDLTKELNWTGGEWQYLATTLAIKLKN